MHTCLGTVSPEKGSKYVCTGKGAQNLSGWAVALFTSHHHPTWEFLLLGRAPAKGTLTYSTCRSDLTNSQGSAAKVEYNRDGMFKCSVERTSRSLALSFSQ